PDRTDTRVRPAARKLSYKLKRELDALPDRIAELEARVTELRGVVNDGAFYRRPQAEVQRFVNDLELAEREVETAVERWAELERLAELAAAGDDVTAP
ncbi:MAG TPA: hypothetical protein VKA43_06585, partial [Gammaproteobacteria bacterium]|nr:hypothetical protein [Gammaproteobacteria bacterium]